MLSPEDKEHVSKIAGITAVKIVFVLFVMAIADQKFGVVWGTMAGALAYFALRLPDF